MSTFQTFNIDEGQTFNIDEGGDTGAIRGSLPYLSSLPAKKFLNR